MSNDNSAYAIVPYGCWPTWGIANMALDDLVWPLGRPERLSSKVLPSGRVRDLTADDHLITFPRKPMFYLPWPGVKARVSVMVVEPDVVHAHHVNNARRMQGRFHRILTKNEGLLASAPNARHFVFGFTFIEDVEGLVVEKTKMTSLIASAKRDLPGHLLRHEMVEYVRGQGLDVDVMGRGYAPFEKKEDGLAPYRYSLVIENSQEASYFSEKLVDACLCKTVPIYWGAPDIGKYFNTDGMIICETKDALSQALGGLSTKDYASRKSAMEENYRHALFYADNLKRATETIRDDASTLSVKDP